jgi:cell division protein FtsW
MAPERWRQLAMPMWCLSVFLLLLVPFLGETVNGARRWLTVPGLGFQFQPSAFARWATLVAVASVLAGRDQVMRHATRASLVAFGLAAVPAGLTFIEPDTGSAAVLMGLVIVLLFVAGTPLRLFVLPAGAMVAALAAAVALRPYVVSRILAFVDPWARADDEGFQLVQSFVAFGRGGLLGVGLGDGRQKLYYLPEAHTDFVLSVLAEELGLVGVAVVIGAFAALLVAGCRIAFRARDRFSFLMASAMTALLTVPAALNAAVVMGMVPPKGIAMPFLSYGRTSLLVSFLAVGTLIGVARRSEKT